MNIKAMKTSLLLTSLILSACGGGGGGGTTQTISGTSSTGSSLADGQPAKPAEVSNGTPAGVASRTRGGCNLTQDTGGFPDRGFVIAGVHWLQSVQQDVTAVDTKIAGGKALRLRVDVTAPRDDYAAPTDNTLQISFADGSCKSYALTMAAANLPKTVNRNTLSGSFVAVIPAADVSTAMTGYQLAINQRRAVVASSVDGLYRSGTMAVQPTISDIIVYQPITFQGMTGYTPGKDSMDSVLKRVWPQASTSSTVEAAWTPTDLKPENAPAPTMSGGTLVYTFSGEILRKVLRELDFNCFKRATFDKAANAIRCISAWPDNVRFQDTSPTFTYAGIAATQGALMHSFSATDNAGGLTGGAQTLIHEFGHQMSLKHANCGGPDQIDADLYADGTLGTTGAAYDEATSRYFAATSATHDVMSYCSANAWSSDKGFRKIIAYKQGNDGAAPAPAARAAASGSPSQDQPVIRLDRVQGRWVAHNTVAPAGLVASTLLPDAGAISALLQGLSMHTIDTDAGQLEDGPYYVRDSAGLRKLLTSGALPVTLTVR